MGGKGSLVHASPTQPPEASDLESLLTERGRAREPVPGYGCVGEYLAALQASACAPLLRVGVRALWLLTKPTAMSVLREEGMGPPTVA